MNGRRNRDRVQCIEVFESIQKPDGSIRFEWLWCVVGAGERYFVAGPHCAPAGAEIRPRHSRFA